jgi:hypothetical protein
MNTMELPPFEFHDKMKLKTNYEKLGVRVVPGAIARYGAYIASGVIMMPGFVNIGAYVCMTGSFKIISILHSPAKVKCCVTPIRRYKQNLNQVLKLIIKTLT